MILNTFGAVFLATAFGSVQAPEGRWDGTITYGTLKVPVTIEFESSGKSLKGSFVNGDTRVSSSEGTFEAGVVRLTFGASGTRLEATVKDEQLKGTFGSAGKMVPFTASKFCSCGPEGDAGPDISGHWEVPDSDIRLSIRRKGDDTLATLSRASGAFGPIGGRFDGLVFKLHYFDGARAAVLEIKPTNNGGLNLKLAEPAAEQKKYRAIKATTQR